MRGIVDWPSAYDGRGIANRSYLDALHGMSDKENRNCPECSEYDAMDRRGFMRTVGGTASILAAGAVAAQAPRVWADAQPAPGIARIAIGPGIGRRAKALREFEMRGMNLGRRAAGDAVQQVGQVSLRDRKSRTAMA